MRTFIIFSSPSCCDKHSPRTFCRLICLHNSLFLRSYKSLLGILCCADSAVVLLLLLQPHRYHKDHKGLGCSCALLWTSLLSHRPLGRRRFCLRRCSPISAHDALESTFSSKSDASQICHMHVSRACGTRKCTLLKSRATTSALLS